MTVYLVGAGPGDPGLLTVRGAELLAQADVVVFDRLASSALLHVVPVQAELIDREETPDSPSLVELGRTHGCVVRLMSGDPSSFPDGGVEAAALAEAGIAFEIIPGVTSAAPAPAHAGRPVSGWKVVVTRSRAQASGLSQQLRDLGAEVVEIPTIATAEPSDRGAALHAAARRIADYDWLVVTSPTGAWRTMQAFVDARALSGVKVAAIGPATAQALAESKLVADLVAPEYVAESLLGALGPPPTGRGSILICRAAEGRDVLPDGLAAAGWRVDVVEAYRTVRPEPTRRQRRDLADADVVTFTSSSTIANFVTAFGVEAVPSTVVCIGPITAATARELGIEVSVEASVHSVDGLVDALVEHVTS